MGETASSHSAQCCWYLYYFYYYYVFRSCSDGSSRPIYNTAAPLGNGSDPGNNRSTRTHASKREF